MIIFNHCFVVLKNVEHHTELRRLRVRRDIIDIAQSLSIPATFSLDAKFLECQHGTVFSRFGPLC